MIVVLEGLEGAGKTTLSKLMCEKLPADYVKSPPAELNSSRQFIAGTKNSDANFYFYLSGLAAIRSDLDRFRGSNQHVIVDRYIHSTIAYHAGGATFDHPLFSKGAITRPDITVHIVCSDYDRKMRQDQRGFHIFERPSNDEEAIKNYFGEIADFEFVNDKDVEKSATELCAHLNKRFLK